MCAVCVFMCVKERLLFIHCGSVPFKATSRQYLTAFTAAAPMLSMKHLKVYANFSYDSSVSVSEAATARHVMREVFADHWLMLCYIWFMDDCLHVSE